MSQLKLPGMDEAERQWAAEQRAAEKKRHEEWEIMLSGIRLDRFVSHLECESWLCSK